MRACAFMRAGALPALLLAAAPALAEDWRLAYRPVEGGDLGRTLAFVDAASIRRTGDGMTFSYQVRFQQEGEIMGIVVEAQADCRTNVYRMLHVAAYRGDTQVQEETPQGGEQTAGEDTNVYQVIQSACARSFLTGTIQPNAFTRAELAAP